MKSEAVVGSQTNVFRSRWSISKELAFNKECPLGSFDQLKDLDLNLELVQEITDVFIDYISRVQPCSTAWPNVHDQIGPRARAACVMLSGLDKTLATHGRLPIPSRNGDVCFKIWPFPRDTKLHLPGYGLHTPRQHHMLFVKLEFIR